MLHRIYLVLLVLLGTAACAAVQPLNPNGPRRNQPPYPVLLTTNQQREADARAAWAQLAQQRGPANIQVLPLQPVTATIKNLPTSVEAALYIPRIGTRPTMDDQETRESLRRFLNQWQKLLGANPAQLSLAQQSKNGGENLAVYEQRAFSYPLRGPYGRIEIHFKDDRRITSLSSTAIPDADKIQAALAASAPQLKTEDVAKHLAGRKITYTDSTGSQTGYVVGSESTISVQQVVIYPVLSSTKPDTLEFHLAWEVNLTSGPVKTIYYDALRDEILAAS
jgi:hypothetical protein